MTGPAESGRQNASQSARAALGLMRERVEKMRIAVLEDDVSQAQLIKQILIASGHDCHVYYEGRALIRQIRRDSYDLLVLDWQVPDLSGPDVVMWVRENVKEFVPILFLTSRTDERDIVTALTCGADDYMAKPVRPGELIARVRALLRRSYPVQHTSTEEAFGPYHFDLRHRQITIDGNPIETTQKEYELALFLFRNVGRLLSRSHLLESVWGHEGNVPSRTIDTHMSRLRTKLALRPENGYRLSPVYSLGYRFEAIGSPTEGQDDA